MGDQIEDVYPLAPLQQGMLCHILQAPADAAGAFWAQEVGDYSIDPMDLEVYRRAWQLVMDRHPALRTGFVWEGVPTPLQVVHAGLKVPLEVLDWSSVDEAEQQQRLERLLAADRARDFDLTEPPLMRVRLVERGGDRWWTVWTFHHICIDGWSIPIVLDEVQTTYDYLSDGAAQPVLPPARPYRDFIQWLSGRDAEQARQFWREYLAGFQAPTPLPVDRPPTSHGPQDTHQLRFSAEVTRGLMDLASKARVTLSTVIQAAWALLLSRFSGHDDVVFGLTVSGRPAELSGMASMVGLFINTLPLRTTIRPDEPFMRWLQRLQDTQVQLQRYDYTPLTDIQKASDITADTPLFDSIITFQNLPEGDQVLNERETDDDATVGETYTTPPARYPLMFSVDLDGVLELWAQFSMASFDRATIERLLDWLGHAMAAVAAAPDTIVRDVPLHPADEVADELVDELTAHCERGSQGARE